MVTTPDDIALQKGAIAPAQKEQTGSSKAVSLIDNLLGKASLPVGTTISPTLQNVAPNELMSAAGVTGTLSAAVPTAPATVPTAPIAADATPPTTGIAEAAVATTAAPEAIPPNTAVTAGNDPVAIGII